MPRFEINCQFGDSDIALLLDYELRPGVPPITTGASDSWDPGEAPEITLNGAWFVNDEAKEPNDKLSPVPDFILKVLSHDNYVYDVLCGEHEDGADPDYLRDLRNDGADIFKEVIE